MTATEIKYGTEIYIPSGVGGFPASRWLVVGVREGTVDLVRIVSGERLWSQTQRVARAVVERAKAR